MEAQGVSKLGIRRPSLSAKAILHQKFGDSACYKVEELLEPIENGCPGLVVPQRLQVLYQCHLELPNCCVTSGKFAKKKDAEQSAAKMVLEKLGIQSTTKELTPEDACNELILRISSLYTDKFLSTLHPIVGHIREAIRKGDYFGQVPASVIAACDVKVNNLCKLINPKAESEPLLAMSLVLKAAKLTDAVCISEQGCSIGKGSPYSLDAESLINHPMHMNHISVEALYVPSSIDQPIWSFDLDLSSGRYYICAISQKLGVQDPSYVSISRTVGKASSETRFYFCTPRSFLSSSYPCTETLQHLEDDINLRASYFAGQNIYGDSVLATVGYTWKSRDLFHEDVSLCTYYRMLLGMKPDGCYKLSREAILVSELPSSYTTKSNWRGMSPRDLLCTFCRHHHLMEPLFLVKEITVSGIQSKGSAYKSTEGVGLSNGKDDSTIEGEPNISVSFICSVKILSRSQNPLMEYLGDIHKRQADAIQNASLSVLCWLNKYFQHLDMPFEDLSSFGVAHKIHVNPEFSQAFGLCLAVHGLEKKKSYNINSLGASHTMVPDGKRENQLASFIIEGPESGNTPSPGSLIGISYSVFLVNKNEGFKEIVENKDEFDFELGTGAVIDQLEVCVSQMCAGQSAHFVVELPSRELILAVAGQSAGCLSQMSLQRCILEYYLEVRQISEPVEERMEQALFSPPLSKQRVEFAVGIINSAHAASLVDFGCGSGSLLDSLLEHPTSLEKIAGVDISVKGLSRAAKVLHTRLSGNSDHSVKNTIKSAVLYDGSITNYDARLYGFDIGTCLEVIEHMEEDQASLFGDIALCLFSPRLLIISTPNYEYNSVLQRIISSSKEDDLEDTSRAAPCRFRNHDHKFEWTRKQFEHWATDLAARHGYTVEFSGVGGSATTEPGFASQIAVFRRSPRHQAEMHSTDEELQPYEIVWEWPSFSSSTL